MLASFVNLLHELINANIAKNSAFVVIINIACLMFSRRLIFSLEFFF
jgi:hypothetical protein